MTVKETLKSIYFRPSVQNNFLKVISPFFPEPENCNYAETRYGVWNTTSNLFQENGRQLGEANVHHGFRHRKFPIEYRECKIEGSRKGIQTNLTALQDIMRNYNDAMQILMLIRNHYIETFSLDSEIFDAGTLFLFTQHIVSLPLFQNRSNLNSSDKNQRIDPQVAVLFQLVAGVFNLIRRLLEDNTENISIDSPVNSEMLYKFSEKNHLFTTPNKKPKDTRVCGGAKQKITELLDVLINGKDNEKLFEANNDALKIRNVNIDRYLTYSLTALQLETTIQRCRLESIHFYLSLDTEKVRPNELKPLESAILNSEYSAITQDPFLNSINKTIFNQAIHYRISFYQAIIDKIQESLAILTPQKETIKDIPKPEAVTYISSINDLKTKIKPMIKVYQQEINDLQLSILEILGNHSYSFFGPYFVSKKISLFGF